MAFIEKEITRLHPFEMKEIPLLRSTSVTDYSYKVFTWALSAPWPHHSSASSCRQGYAGHRPDHWRPGLSPYVGYHTTSCQRNKRHNQHQQLHFIIINIIHSVWYRMLSLSATILSLSWKAQSLRHLATSASCTASFSSWDMASHCFLNTSISLLARSMSSVAESCFCSNRWEENLWSWGWHSVTKKQ